MTALPRLLITMGDVAGIGPEIIARAWPRLRAVCRPVVVGSPDWLQQAFALAGTPVRVEPITHLDERATDDDVVLCLQTTEQDLRQVKVGEVSAAAGRAAYDFLCAAIDLVTAGQADGIVTCPLHKEGLRAAGLIYPGHTEILADRTGTREYAMLLYCDGLGVAHVTLHMALRDVFAKITTPAVLEKIRLLDDMLSRLLGQRPRLGVCALNPHASDGGLFGDEEKKIIEPAVRRARADGIEASGPWPSDTLFRRARLGEFDGVVAMYHDQGHIAIKVLGPERAVNITAGLPIVRTSVAHGTAYDIAGHGLADASGLVAAVEVAAQLARVPAVKVT
ncbi:MAG: 4-hydroxythreonine-4-phosphate dehydrogenase PdxA [Gemmataceae bacterium]